MNLGYRQDAFGVQIGLDLLRAAPDGGVTAGVTGGYLNSTTRSSAGGGDRFEVDAGDVGLYAGFRAGAFFADALAKYDVNGVDRRSYAAAFAGKDDAHAWGGRIEGGCGSAPPGCSPNRGRALPIAALCSATSRQRAARSTTTASPGCAAGRGCAGVA